MKSVASLICGEIGDRGGGLILSGIGGGVGEMCGRVMVGFRRGIGGTGGGGDGGAASLFGGRFGGTVAKGFIWSGSTKH